MIPPLPYVRRCDGLRGPQAAFLEPQEDKEHVEEQGVNRARTGLPGRKPFLISRPASSLSPVVAGSNADRVTVRPEVIRPPLRDVVLPLVLLIETSPVAITSGCGRIAPGSAGVPLGLEQKCEQAAEQDLNRSRTGLPARERYGLRLCYFCVCLVCISAVPHGPVPGKTRKGSIPRCRIMQGAAGMKMPDGRHGMSERCEVV